MQNPITPANISWQTDNNGLEVPISEDFGDVYFSRDNGLAETRHVFLQGNDLESRLNQLPNYQTFTIGELGFGTGLNVLAIWQLWKNIQARNNRPYARLHVVTTELFPLTKPDLQRALASWAELAQLSEKLIEQYPPLIKGLHRIEFPEDNFSIDLWLGDASESLEKVAGSGNVNAWFLDGFAPKCNETLWADAVLNQIKRLSTNNTSVATFSVASTIKRGLKERGFAITKVKGFGRKREMLTAKLIIDEGNIDDCIKTPVAKSVAVIGAGITGLCTAYALAERGHNVLLLDKTAPLAGSSGNLRAMLAPKLTPIHHVHEHMHSISYLYSARFYANINKQHLGVFEQTGVFDLLKQSNVSAEQVQEYPNDFACMLTSEQANQQVTDASKDVSTESTAHMPITLPYVMSLPKGGLINPNALAEFILQHKNIQFKQACITQIDNCMHDNEVNNSAQHVQLTTAENSKITVDMVVIATAESCADLHKNLPTPRTTRGQISWLTVTDKTASKLPKVPLKYGGYCALVNNHNKDDGSENQKTFLMGASFIRGTTDLSIKEEEHIISKEKLTLALPDLEPTIHTLLPVSSWQGRAGLRAQMPDYLPLVGEVSQNIYSICAMGSKGFAYAPLCAEVLAGMLGNETLPLPNSLIKKLNPLRFTS